MVQTAEIRETETTNLGEKFYRILIDELATPDGILASSRQEKYGCVFGRDTAITVLGMVDLLRDPPPFVDTNELAAKAKIGLLKLASLQGTKIDRETGEQPGKIPHEYRETDHERLTKISEYRKKPWKTTPDGKLLIYFSEDSTPLFLKASIDYIQATKDYNFLVETLPQIQMGANWILTYGDADSDGLLEYDLPEDMDYGGLPVQSWADSREYLLDKNGNFPKYPIAPVADQGMAWGALKSCADLFKNSNLNYPPNGIGWREFGQKLESKADEMKRRFNEAFLIRDKGLVYAAQALDGDKKQITTITADPLLAALWATHEKDGTKESILETRYIDDFVKRAFMTDLYVPGAGIRTMSSESPTFNPKSDSYHNGSIWLMQTSAIWKGLKIWGYEKEANLLAEAIRSYVEYTGYPAELLNYNGKGLELYRTEWGATSCLKQSFGIPYTIQALTKSPLISIRA